MRIFQKISKIFVPPKNFRKFFVPPQNLRKFFVPPQIFRKFFVPPKKIFVRPPRNLCFCYAYFFKYDTRFFISNARLKFSIFKISENIED